jgi:small subunit ribosomal protein S1
VGAIAEGPVTSLAKFGAFIDLGDGIEGMIHIADISADKEKRLNHPNEVLKIGEKVRAQVLEADKDRRRLRLGIRQLVPTSIDEYIEERKAGQTVTGRIVKVSGDSAKVELGEGVFGQCKLPSAAEKRTEAAGAAKADVSSLSEMLASKWKSGGGGEAAAEAPKSGQIRDFRISSVDPASKRIELELL